MITIVDGVGDSGKTTVYIRRGSPTLDEDPNEFIAISTRCAHLGCPVRFVQAAGTSSAPATAGLRLRGPGDRRTAGTPARSLPDPRQRDTVEVGPRYSVTNDLEPVRARDPGEFTGGSGSTCTRPARPRPRRRAEADDAEAPTALRKPPKPGERGNGARRDGGGAKGAEAEPHPVREKTKEGAIDVVGWVDQRTGASPFSPDAAAQGPEGDELVLHTRLGDPVRIRRPGADRGLLAFYYVPSATEAYDSISHLTNDVFLGEFVRGLHKWGATMMIILIFLHMGRTFFFGAYKYPRELNWVIGVVLLILTLVMGLTGYCCRSTTAPTGRRSWR